ncbi:hypothetical protein AVEN_200773-1 [Araneus ventricosus]|uniref:Uncharacterized protein n=1 Tax=Araneus ventricosus TaxID=182803 RepID=A0A4Y2DXK3_ARAVE|nr:hypothetical protein AVEN_200773-1 [Araneus ventricosus]
MGYLSVSERVCALAVFGIFERSVPCSFRTCWAVNATVCSSCCRVTSESIGIGGRLGAPLAEMSRDASAGDVSRGRHTRAERAFFLRSGRHPRTASTCSKARESEQKKEKEMSASGNYTT